SASTRERTPRPSLPGSRTHRELGGSRTATPDHVAGGDHDERRETIHVRDGHGGRDGEENEQRPSDRDGPHGRSNLFPNPERRATPLSPAARPGARLESVPDPSRG